MNVYVAEIGGRGLAAFDAADDTEAVQVRLTDKAFRRDLIVLQNQGRALWDGVSEIQMRRASREEAVRWQSGMTADGKDRLARTVSCSLSPSSISPITNMTITIETDLFMPLP